MTATAEMALGALYLTGRLNHLSADVLLTHAKQHGWGFLIETEVKAIKKFNADYYSQLLAEDDMSALYQSAHMEHAEILWGRLSAEDRQKICELVYEGAGGKNRNRKARKRIIELGFSVWDDMALIERFVGWTEEGQVYRHKKFNLGEHNV